MSLSIDGKLGKEKDEGGGAEKILGGKMPLLAPPRAATDFEV